jgi:hypothetical protein
VNVIFGVSTLPPADAGSRGLAAPAPVNVIFGVLIVAPFVGAAGCSGFVGTPGFASGGLISGAFTIGFAGTGCADAVLRSPSGKARSKASKRSTELATSLETFR